MRTTFKKEEQKKHTGKSEFIGATGFFFVKFTTVTTTTTYAAVAAAALNIYQCVAIVVSHSLSLSVRANAPFNIPQ